MKNLDKDTLANSFIIGALVGGVVYIVLKVLN